MRIQGAPEGPCSRHAKTGLPGMELRQMFGWFKRASKAPPAKAAAARRSTSAPAAPAKKDAGARPPPFLPSGPAALPEVVGEGNTEAEWSQWEDSVMALDSQMQELVPSQRIYVRDTRPSKLDDLPDAFSSVRRKRDV